MDAFLNRFARTGSMKLSIFIRDMRAAGLDHWRSEVIAELSRRGFTISAVANQTWIIGLSPRMPDTPLRAFIDRHCLRADGLTCKLAAIVRGCGMKRAEVISQLEQFGFEIARDGVYVVRGLGLKEPNL